jgi:hypothetical protein
MSPFLWGLGVAALDGASSSPDTILGHKSNYAESQLVGFRREVNRPVARRSTSPRVRDDLPRLDGATLASLSKRPTTLWSVRSAGRGPSGVGRAQATKGRQTSGGAVAVERVFGGER